MEMKEKTYDNSKFKWIRHHFNLSQKEFAERLGTKQQVIAMIENGKRDVPKSIRKNFFEIYGISYEEAANCSDDKELTLLLEFKSNNSGIQEKTFIEAFENYLKSKQSSEDIDRLNIEPNYENLKISDNCNWRPDLILKNDKARMFLYYMQELEKSRKPEVENQKCEDKPISNINYVEEDKPISSVNYIEEDKPINSDNSNKVNFIWQKSKENFTNVYKEYQANKVNNYIVEIPLHDIGAAAGAGTWLSDEPEVKTMFFDKRFLQQIIRTSNYNSLHLIYATGDSMDSGWNQPDDIKDGDLLMVDTSQKTGNNNIFVIRVNNSELRVKRLFKRNNALFVSSNNPKYPEEVYYPDNTDNTIEVIGKVIWHGAKEIA